MSKRPARNRGVEALKRLMKEYSFSQADVARSLVVRPSVVSRYLSGDRTPDTARAAKMQALYGISVGLWVEGLVHAA